MTSARALSARPRTLVVALALGVAAALTLVAGALIGVVSGLLIIRAHIDSFIATLGMSSILIAGIAWVSNGEQILGLGQLAGDTGEVGIGFQGFEFADLLVFLVALLQEAVEIFLRHLFDPQRATQHAAQLDQSARSGALAYDHARFSLGDFPRDDTVTAGKPVRHPLP